MEFPELGTHCASPVCSRLDFLPVKCDACQHVFCKDHGPYDKHNCAMAYTKDARVPVCPLCEQPVPVNRGEDPNIKVNVHIQNECKSDKAKNITSRCSVQGCKKKELVPVTCSTCRKNFCLKHRFETDHNCQGHPQRLGSASVPNRSGGSKKGSDVRRSGAPQKTTLSGIGAQLNRERMMRLQNKTSPTAQPSAHSTPLKPEIGEDEAMARAIAASIGDSTPHPAPSNSTSSPPSHPPPHPHTSHSTAPTSIAEDEALARAIAASLNDQEIQDQPKPKPKKTSSNSSQGARGREKSTGSDSCTIS